MVGILFTSNQHSACLAMLVNIRGFWHVAIPAKLHRTAIGDVLILAGRTEVYYAPNRVHNETWSLEVESAMMPYRAKHCLADRRV